MNNVLLAGVKVILETHLTQLGFTCGACRLFAKNKEGIQKKLKKHEM